MVENLINTYEKLRKYYFIITVNNKSLLIKFNNENFYHLIGLHKLNLDIYFPIYVKSKEEKYKYIKKNIKKFNKIIINNLKEKPELQIRITTFHNIIDLLIKKQDSCIYNLKNINVNSQLNADYGLYKDYNIFNCLLGLRINENIGNKIKCIPISWIANTRKNKLIISKRPYKIKDIIKIPIEEYNKLKITT